MTVKALRRQLMAAIAMVVVAVVALSSSTYAWFVNNNEVTAQGMSVNATSDESLLIKGTDPSEVFGSVGTTTISQTEMTPATSADGVNFAKLGNSVKVEQSSDSKATWSGTNGTFQDGDLVSVSESEKTKYYETAEFTIKSVGSASDIYVSEIVVSDSKDIFKATRIAVTITDSTGSPVTKVFNPQSSTNTESKVGTYSSSSWSLASDTSVYTDMTNAQIWNLAKDKEYTVTIKIWFEGQDVNCYTDNIQTTGTGITVKFSKYTT